MVPPHSRLSLPYSQASDSRIFSTSATCSSSSFLRHVPCRAAREHIRARFMFQSSINTQLISAPLPRHHRPLERSSIDAIFFAYSAMALRQRCCNAPATAFVNETRFCPAHKIHDARYAEDASEMARRQSRLSFSSSDAVPPYVAYCFRVHDAIRVL